jgi:hypothetical protein
MNQLDRILEVTGRPSDEDIDAIKSSYASTMYVLFNPLCAHISLFFE